MKRTQKANKLSLFGLAALLSLVSAPSMASMGEGYESDQETSSTSTQTPEEKALALIKPFFTDPNYRVHKSFAAMCCEVAPLLEQSQDALLKAVAQVLKEVCKHNSPVKIGLALKKYEKALKNFIGEMLPGTIIYARLEKAIRIK